MTKQEKSEKLEQIGTMTRGELEKYIYQYLVTNGCDEDSAEGFLDGFVDCNSLRSYLYECWSQDLRPSWDGD